MSGSEVPPSWRLPEGVDGALWTYAHTARLAEEEDRYFTGHPLFETDRRVVEAWFREPARLVDLGCGAGRHALDFARRGFPVVAVELSGAMLRRVAEKARDEGLQVGRVRANLCRLGCFRDGTFAYALSMFSTLGMIRGCEERRRALAEAARILAPGGKMALHAHNIWLNLKDPQGWLWLASQYALALAGHDEAGDRRMTYRGIPDMKVHLYRWGELRRDIRRAGLTIEESIPLDAVRARPIPLPRLAPAIRAGGWLLRLRKAGT